MGISFFLSNKCCESNLWFLGHMFTCKNCFLENQIAIIHNINMTKYSTQKYWVNHFSNNKLNKKTNNGMTKHFQQISVLFYIAIPPIWWPEPYAFFCPLVLTTCSLFLCTAYASSGVCWILIWILILSV